MREEREKAAMQDVKDHWSNKDLSTVSYHAGDEAKKRVDKEC